MCKDYAKSGQCWEKKTTEKKRENAKKDSVLATVAPRGDAAAAQQNTSGVVLRPPHVLDFYMLFLWELRRFLQACSERQLRWIADEV